MQQVRGDATRFSLAYVALVEPGFGKLSGFHW